MVFKEVIHVSHDGGIPSNLGPEYDQAKIKGLFFYAKKGENYGKTRIAISVWKSKRRK